MTIQLRRPPEVFENIPVTAFFYQFIPDKMKGKAYCGSRAKTTGNGIAMRSPMTNVAKSPAIIQP